MENLKLQTHIGSDESAETLFNRYQIDTTTRDTVTIELDQETSDALNLAVITLFLKITPGTHAEPTYYEKNGKTYNTVLAVNEPDECSYVVDVGAMPLGGDLKDLNSLYKVRCVQDPDCGLVALIDDSLAMSQNFNRVSELDLNDIVNILNSAQIVND